MGEPSGKEGREEAAAAGPVPEGFAYDEEHHQGAARRGGLPLFPTSHRSAGTLDLAAANDEPTQLIRYLIIAAKENLTESEHAKEWQVLYDYFERANMQIEAMQEPTRK